jgi:hypothetical protein
MMDIVQLKYLNMEYNIYCDESYRDDHKSMVIGAVWCAFFTDKKRYLKEE